MAPLPIVEDLDVLEHRAPRRGARGPERVVDKLDLERGEETLGHCVVPAVANCRVMRSLIAQPTMLREHRSGITAR